MLIPQNQPDVIDSRIELSGSKSISNRLLVLKYLCNKSLEITHISDSGDTKTMSDVLAKMETQQDGTLYLNIADAGTVARFVVALCAATDGSKFQVEGTERMNSRPMGALVNLLREMGADIEYQKTDGCLPVLIQGKKLYGGNYTIESGQSSQFTSAVLLISPSLSQPLSLKYSGKTVSTPYINMTVQIMRRFGFKITHDAQGIQCSNEFKRPPKKFKVESDWSATLYFLIINTYNLKYHVQVGCFDFDSLQGDRHIDSFLYQIGLSLVFNDNLVSLVGQLQRPEIVCLNLENQPDLAQPISCFCVSHSIPFHLSGLSTLEYKETRRLSALKEVFTQLDIECEISSSEIWVNAYRPRPKKMVYLDSYNDHRMAMSYFLLWLGGFSIAIENESCIEKSVPKFWHYLETMGFTFERTN